MLPQRRGQFPRVGQVKYQRQACISFPALARDSLRFRMTKCVLLLQRAATVTGETDVAVLHWLHLWKSPDLHAQAASGWVFSVLDPELLDLLALRWELSVALQAWKSEVSSTGIFRSHRPLKGR